MTAGEIAKLLGVSRSTVGRIRSGERPLMCDEVALLAEASHRPWSAVAKRPLSCIEDLLERHVEHSADVDQIGQRDRALAGLVSVETR